MAEALWRTWQNTKDPQWLQQAATSALRARQLNDRLAPVQIILGRIESSRGRNQEAIRAFRRALELEPLNPDAYRALAITWASMGNLVEAEVAYRKVGCGLASGSAITTSLSYTPNKTVFTKLKPFFKR